MFAYPISSNADDQEALLKIHQQLYVKAQSLDEQLDLAFNKKHDFSIVYANPELLPSVRLDHLLFISDLRRKMRYDFLSKPLDTLVQQAYASDSGLAIKQLLNEEQLACSTLRIIGVKKLCILRQQQEELINGLRLIVINRKTMAPPVDIEGSVLKNDSNDVIFYGNIITSLELNIQLEVLKNNLNDQDFNTDMMMKLLEAYNSCMISREIIPFITAENIFFGDKGDNMLKLITEFYQRNDYFIIGQGFSEIVNRIVQSDTLSKELQCKSLELLFDRTIKLLESSIHQGRNLVAYRELFQDFIRELDPEISDKCLGMLPNSKLISEYVSYGFKQLLIDNLKSILDQGKFQRTKVAPREDDVS